MCVCVCVWGGGGGGGGGLWLEEFHSFQTGIVPFKILKNMNAYKGL